MARLRVLGGDHVEMAQGLIPLAEQRKHLEQDCPGAHIRGFRFSPPRSRPCGLQKDGLPS
ncbi:MAG: hypothetical protein MZV70_53460 [Desulfobacterales bacterium]|nr:hypothetical protein [Desulfobacterales bacterium]